MAVGLKKSWGGLWRLPRRPTPCPSSRKQDGNGPRYRNQVFRLLAALLHEPFVMCAGWSWVAQAARPKRYCTGDLWRCSRLIGLGAVTGPQKGDHQALLKRLVATVTPSRTGRSPPLPPPPNDLIFFASLMALSALLTLCVLRLLGLLSSFSLQYPRCFQENADEVEMVKRVEGITDKLLREKFPDAYTPAPKKKRVSCCAFSAWQSARTSHTRCKPQRKGVLNMGAWWLSTCLVPRGRCEWCQGWQQAGSAWCRRSLLMNGGSSRELAWLGFGGLPASNNRL